MATFICVTVTDNEIMYVAVRQEETLEEAQRMTELHCVGCVGERVLSVKPLPDLQEEHYDILAIIDKVRARPGAGDTLL